VSAAQPAARRSVIERARRGYLLAVAAPVCVLLGAVVVMMGVPVVFRYLLGGSLIWAEEV
jgi:TRAP-type C4-dicarboxylate transport system permease small subunit